VDLQTNTQTLIDNETEAELNLAEGGGSDWTFIMNSITNPPGGPDSQPDPNLGSTASLRWPRYGNQCVLINQDGKQQNANALWQSTIVGPGMINPLDGLL